MRTRFLLFFLALFLVSCSSKKEHYTAKEVESWPVVKVDSIFKDLDKPIYDRKTAQLDKSFQNLKKKTTFNGTVLFAEKGRILLEKSYGVSNLKTRKGEIKVDDVFQLSSVSKMFTAEAIMILKSRQLLDYDVDIKTYIPEFPYEGITTRMLMTHRSGLSRYETLADNNWPDKRKPFTNDDMIDYYIKYKPDPYFSPNNGFHYCNVNYALLASIVERVSGKRFVDFMREDVFDVIGMNDSYIYDMPTDTMVSLYLPNCVQGYYVGRRRPRQAQNEYLNGVKGDKIMFSNVEDMYRFKVAIDYGLLVPDSIQEEAFKPGSPKYSKRKDNYGFGWRISRKHPDCYYHYGWWKGYRSFFMFDKKNDRTLIVLTNTDKGPNSDVFWKMLKDNTISLAPASINIPVMELEKNLNYPFSSYRDR
ncbi:MAG: beta-lactamase family protein [Bacteroidales bacterium]|nr:beta-lactamase family protein [Bacteroidales bacterium]